MSEPSRPTYVPSRRLLHAALRVFLTVAILGLLWHLTDGPAVLALLGQAHWPWLLAALVTAHLQILLSAMRWRLTAAQLDQSLRRRDAIREYYLSQFVNLAIPGGVLGDAGRAVRQRHQAGLLRAAQAVMLERMIGQVAMFGVLFGGFVVAVLIPGGLVLPAWIADLVGWFAVLLVVLCVLAVVLSRVPGAVSRITAGFMAALRLGLLARGVWPRQVGLSIVIVACNLGSFAFCAAATGTILPLVAVVTILPLILTSMMIPLSVGGWGLREGAAAAIWPVVGAQAEAGIAASIAFGLIILAASLPGVWGLLARRSSLAK